MARPNRIARRAINRVLSSRLTNAVAMTWLIAAVMFLMPSCQRQPVMSHAAFYHLPAEGWRYNAPVGLRVPEDVMLTGFADLPVAALMTPPLTTVRQNREQMAQAAFRRLMERIADPSLPYCDIFLPANLVIRGSTERGTAK